MDHITRCPNCSTAFRVTDEQLAAFMGKVRCGRCAFVFNARDAFIPHTLPKTEPLPEPHHAMPAEPEVQTTPAPEPQVAEATPPEPEAKPEAVTEEIAPETATPSEAEQPAQLEALSVADLYAQSLEDIKATESLLESLEETTQTTDESDPTALMHTSADNIPAETVETPGGYRPITLPEDEALFAPIAKPRHSRIWTFATVLLGLVLAGQILFAYRVRVAMEFPALQPRLNTLCKTLGCSMPLPRQPDLLRLEWSELTYLPDQPTLIQLSATLRNLASFEQALPLMELTLTDTQERIVARRIFHPNEYLAVTEKARRSLPGNDELHAFLQLETGDLKSTGYSLYWFY